MKSTIFASESDRPRPLIQIVIIILILIVGIASTLMICEWMFNLLLADRSLNALQNYGSYAN